MVVRFNWMTHGEEFETIDSNMLVSKIAQDRLLYCHPSDCHRVNATVRSQNNKKIHRHSVAGREVHGYLGWLLQSSLLLGKYFYWYKSEGRIVNRYYKNIDAIE